MKISIFGTGYVGLVTGTCLSDVGHHVACIDIDTKKIEDLTQGKVSIYEPGLESLVKSNLEAKRLSFTNNAEKSILESDVIFIAVGTPMAANGSADISTVLLVAETIGKYINSEKIIICKSTVPVGTTEAVKAIIQKELNRRGSTQTFYVASNPEFLKEGDAVKDFMRPDRIVIGMEAEAVKSVMQELYAPFNRNHQKIIFMDIRSAELTKYAANAMLATKISFINEMANIAEKLGADIENVRIGIGSDSRIGYNFIYPGCGFGGSCFPKDISALKFLAQNAGYEAELLEAVENVNVRQKQRIVEKVGEHYNGNIKGKVFAVWGLSFKPKTDDMREAPSIVIIKSLQEKGAIVQAYDPKAIGEAKKIFGESSLITYFNSKESAIEDADALIICTEWQDFKAPDINLFKSNLKDKVIFDGRNLYNTKQLFEQGVSYYSIGR